MAYVQKGSSKTLYHPKGDPHQTELQTVWNSDEMNPLRTIHKKRRYAENSVCKACIENSQMWGPEVR